MFGRFHCSGALAPEKECSCCATESDARDSSSGAIEGVNANNCGHVHDRESWLEGGTATCCEQQRYLRHHELQRYTWRLRGGAL